MIRLNLPDMLIRKFYAAVEAVHSAAEAVQSAAEAVRDLAVVRLKSFL
jgi:hypothetical protein